MPSTEQPLLSIPPQYQSGLDKLRRLDQASAKALLSALQGLPPMLNSNAVISRLGSHIGNIPQSDLVEIMLALFSLYSLRTQLESSPSQVAEYITRAMDESGLEEMRIPIEERERFKQRLTELLNVESIEIGGKANNVLFENEHVLRDVRILTDIRPVFSSDPEDPPRSAVILHLLRVTYLEGGANKDIYFALDESDIDVLQGLLERASKKAKSLRSVLAAANMTHITPE